MFFAPLLAAAVRTYTFSPQARIRTAVRARTARRDYEVLFKGMKARQLAGQVRAHGLAGLMHTHGLMYPSHAVLIDTNAWFVVELFCYMCRWVYAITKTPCFTLLRFLCATSLLPSLPPLFRVGVQTLISPVPPPPPTATTNGSDCPTLTSVIRFVNLTSVAGPPKPLRVMPTLRSVRPKKRTGGRGRSCASGRTHGTGMYVHTDTSVG